MSQDLHTTVPGGIYLTTNGRVVNANGEPLNGYAVIDGEVVAVTVVEPIGGDSLPKDFPGYNALVAAGITTYGALEAIEDLTDIDGIGPATAADIVEALND